MDDDDENGDDDDDDDDNDNDNHGNLGFFAPVLAAPVAAAPVFQYRCRQCPPALNPFGKEGDPSVR